MSAGDPGEPRTVRATAAAADATPTPAPAGPIQGYVDKIGNQRVRGWAWHRGQPSAVLDIEVRLDGRLLASGRADRLRPDLARANVGDGRKGYDVAITEPLTEDQLARLVVSARLGAEGAATPLVNRVFETPPPQTPGEPEVAAAGARAVTKLPIGREGEGQAVIRALADLSGRLERQLADMAGALDRMDNGLAVQERARELVDRQIVHLETVQARIDAILAQDAAQRQAGARRRSFERGLVVTVAIACVLSLASLLIGLHSIFS